MNVPDSVVCPSCEDNVKPLRRKVPRDPNTPNPLIEFGWFCPIEARGVRLEKAIAAQQNEVVEESNEISELPVEIREHLLPVSLTPVTTNVRPIKPHRTDENLFDRIRQEHERIVAEEKELINRLAMVQKNRKKLDLLVSALEKVDEQSELIAAE